MGTPSGYLRRRPGRQPSWIAGFGVGWPWLLDCSRHRRGFAAEEKVSWLQTYRGFLYRWEVDHNDHLTVAYYLARVADAGLGLLEALGLGPAYMKRSGRGCVTSDCYVRYQRELRVGDILHIESGVIRAERDTLVLGHKVFNSENGEVCTTVEQSVRHVDLKRRAAACFTSCRTNGTASASPPSSSSGSTSTWTRANPRPCPTSSAPGPGPSSSAPRSLSDHRGAPRPRRASRATRGLGAISRPPCWSGARCSLAPASPPTPSPSSPTSSRRRCGLAHLADRLRDGLSVRRRADQRDHARRAHRQLLDPPDSRDEPRRAGRSAEAPRLQRPRERVDEDRAVLLTLGKLAHEVHDLVVGRRVRLPRRGGVRGLVAARLCDRRRGAPGAAPAPPVTPPRIARRRGLARLRRRGAGDRAGGEPVERDAERRRDVTDGVEGAVVRHDLEHVARTGRGEPHARAHRDAEVAPVAHPGGRRAVDELGAVAREQARCVLADHPPVPDGDEFGPPARAVDGEARDHAPG